MASQQRPNAFAWPSQAISSLTSAKNTDSEACATLRLEQSVLVAVLARQSTVNQCPDAGSACTQLARRASGSGWPSAHCPSNGSCSGRSSHSHTLAASRRHSPIHTLPPVITSSALRTSPHSSADANSASAPPHTAHASFASVRVCSGPSTQRQQRPFTATPPPSQQVPSVPRPEKPSLHLHSKPPAAMWHSAFKSQLCAPMLHMSTTGYWCRSFFNSPSLPPKM
eukprot:657393-Rhodomonas_salina.3